MFKYFYQKYRSTIWKPRDEQLLRRLSQSHQWHRFFEHLIYGTRFWPFDRIVTPRFNKELGPLKTYNYDIRQIFFENAIKDIALETDSKFVSLFPGKVTYHKLVSLTRWQKVKAWWERADWIES